MSVDSTRNWSRTKPLQSQLKSRSGKCRPRTEQNNVWPKQRRPLRSGKVRRARPGVKRAAGALQRGGCERRREAPGGCPDESRDAEPRKHSRCKLCLEPGLETITDTLRISVQFSSTNIYWASTPCQAIGAAHQDTCECLQPPTAPGGEHKATVQRGWALMDLVHRGAYCLSRAVWSRAREED